MSDDTTSLDEFDLTLGMDFDATPGDIHGLAATLEEAEDFDAENADDETLAEYSAALKRLENAAEDARKEVFEDELNARTEVNQEVGPVVKRQGSRSFVVDEAGAVEAIQDAGGNPLEAMTMKAAAAEEVLDALGLDPEDYLGVNEYEYFRRQA